MGDAGDPTRRSLRIVIVGAGLGGLAAAVGLAEHHQVTVFEATKELVTVDQALHFLG